MPCRSLSALLFLLAACATTEPRTQGPVSSSQRVANLQRAAVLPWRDEGQCVVHEAGQPWPVVVERCFHALDSKRIRFRDTERRCPVIRSQVPELRRERGLAGACGFDFRVGVRRAAHKAALERAEPEFEGLIVVMGWC
ncbi:DUF6310 domain-containing protein [Hyalangium versicolor]|uniref:DUF6310 domain-containing protein n=1 Tax=Hyalangium versicolor TaxID=2861190 RepID=UPI001CCF3EC7|nr:DUF6310 domain-containing protein [Hyalangium versicolor]